MKKEVTMDLQSRKIEFVQAFLKLQSEEVNTQLEKLLKKETKKTQPGLKSHSLKFLHQSNFDNV